MRCITTALIASLLAATGARAGMLEIEVPEAVETVTAVYRCPDTEIAVTYYNAGTNALAVLGFDGQTLVMANVLSASGVKYAGGEYVWWTKGDNADFYDLRKGEETPPVSCTQAR